MPQTIRRLQKLSDGHWDIVLRSYVHTSNQHKGLLDIQVEELKKVKICILDILEKVENTFNKKKILDYQNIIDLYQHIRDLADQFNKVQIERIRNDTSKTRPSLLYYAFLGNCLMLTKQKSNCSRFSTNPFNSINSCQSHIINLILRRPSASQDLISVW